MDVTATVRRCDVPWICGCSLIVSVIGDAELVPSASVITQFVTPSLTEPTKRKFRSLFQFVVPLTTLIMCLFARATKGFGTGVKGQSAKTAKLRFNRKLRMALADTSTPIGSALKATLVLPRKKIIGGKLRRPPDSIEGNSNI